MAVPLKWASYLLLQDQFLKLHFASPFARFFAGLYDCTDNGCLQEFT